MSIHACHRCESRQRPCSGSCLCLRSNLDIIDMQVRGCPLGKFGPSEDGGTLAPAEGQVLNERRATCESCPIGSFEGWADRNRTVARCRECDGCRRQGNAVGLIAIAIHRCPRGHHDG